MKKYIPNGIAAILIVLASCTVAETREASVTGHFLMIDDGEVVTQPNGTQVLINALWHSTNIDDDTGEQTSNWCRGTAVLDDEGAQVAGAGFCTAYADNGDVAWFSFRNKAGQPGTWTAIGGTGQFEGQTGSGTGEQTSARGDGRAWTTQFKGTLTTP